MPEPFTLRTPTRGEPPGFHQQLNQLLIANPTFVHAIVLGTGYAFAKELAAGTVVPVDRARRAARRLEQEQARAGVRTRRPR